MRKLIPALLAAALSAAAASVTLAAAHIRRHGRRRNWQPAPTESWQEPAAGRSGP